MLVVPMFLLYAGGMTASAAEESKTIEYNCVGSAAGLIDVDIDMDVEINANVPESVEPGESFSIDNSYTNISMGVTDILKTAANPLEGNVPQFNLELTGTDKGEETVNVAEDPLSFGPIDIADDDETVEFSVPEEGGIDVDLTAGESGEVVITAGEIVTVVHAGVAGIELDVEVTCNPTENNDSLVLNEIPIKDPADEDTTPPEITLNGDNPMELEVGEEYVEPGATAEDDVDGDLTDEIEISGDVNTDEPGEYEVVYTVTDAAGNEATVTRTVIVVEPEDPGNGDDAVNAVNEADSPEELWAALENEDLGLNLQAVEDYNTYRKTKLAEHILENRPEEGFEVGFAESGDDDYDVSVQKALNNANYELFLDPFRPEDPVEPAFDAVNNADSVEEMQAALENEDLGLNLDAYNALSTDEKAEVAARVLENRPEDDEGYPLPDDIQAALDQAVDEVGEEDPEEPGDGDESGGVWFSGEGEPEADLGDEGDFYLDESTGDYYKKTSEGWELRGNLKGEDGEDGATWLVGEGKPAAEKGNEGDLYLDVDSGDVYLKSAEGWSIIANLQGPEGPQGSEGPKGEKGEPGKDCDCDNNGDHDGDNSQDGNKDNGSDDEDSANGTDDADNNGGQLPKTATNIPLFMLIGSLLAIIGGALVFLRKKSTV